MKNFISVKDVQDTEALVQKAMKIKKSPYADQEIGKNKVLGLVFFNSKLVKCQSSNNLTPLST